MSTPEAGDPGAEISRRVLVFAPIRADEKVLVDVLSRNDMAPVACANEEELAGQMDECSALVMSQEALTPAAIDTIARHLSAQPAWSELPLILLVDNAGRGGSTFSGLRQRLPRAKMVILQRPIRTVEFVSVAHNALLARRRQFQLRDHIAWQQELQRELNHRVKNILANVTAIYYMTLRQSESLSDFSAGFEGRLSALSKVHSALAAAEQAQPLRLVAEWVLAPYGIGLDERVILRGPAVELRPDTAVAFALGLHELATNAAKYGAFSTSNGSVSLVWERVEADGESAAKVVWMERGGPLVVPPARQGYGTRFVQTALKSGTGAAVDLHFGREGLICTFTIPVADVPTSNPGGGADPESKQGASGNDPRPS